MVIATNSRSFCQDKERGVEITAGAGYAIDNHPDFPEVDHAALVASVRYTERFSGTKPWHKYYHYPLFGVNLTFGSLGNRDVLGYYAGIMSDLSFSSLIEKKTFLEFTAGMGIGWFSDPFNEISNPENIVIGSKFTFSANAALSINRRISENSLIQLKAMIIHCSNSHYELPNVGLNLPSLQLGYKYFISKRTPFLEDTTSFLTSGNWRPVLRLALAFNEQGGSTGPVNGPKYPIYLVSMGFSRKFSMINKGSIALEYYFNSGSKDYILSQRFYREKINKRSSVIALTIGHEFLFGHVGVVTTIGFNIYNKFHQDRIRVEEIEGFKEKLKTFIPARLGFQYYLKDATSAHRNNLFAGIYIKSNFGQADFLESSIGYTF